jgi:hypothetical protein
MVITIVPQAKDHYFTVFEMHHNAAVMSQSGWMQQVTEVISEFVMAVKIYVAVFWLVMYSLICCYQCFGGI